MVAAGNSSNAMMLLWASMRMFQFGMGLLMQSHTGCSLPSHADFPDSRALLRQTWARISLFSSLGAWKLAMRSSSADKGRLPPPSILWHRAAQSELEALSWTELPFLRESQHLCIVVTTTLVFPPSLLQNHLSGELQSHDYCDLVFFLPLETKVFTPWRSHLWFSSALQRQTQSKFATKCLYQWKRKKKHLHSAASGSCVYSETCGKSPRRLKD